MVKFWPECKNNKNMKIVKNATETCLDRTVQTSTDNCLRKEMSWKKICKQSNLRWRYWFTLRLQRYVSCCMKPWTHDTFWLYLTLSGTCRYFSFLWAIYVSFILNIFFVIGSKCRHLLLNWLKLENAKRDKQKSERTAGSYTAKNVWLINLLFRKREAIT